MVMVERGPKCPKCKRIAVQLLAINDNGTGERVCRKCKREIRKVEKKLQGGQNGTK